MNVLVVDDEESIRNICERGLPGPRLKVLTAATAAQAREMLAKHQFDIVLTDIHMETEDAGLELARFTRKTFPETDVIVMTGYDTIDAAVNAMKLGACEFVIKPFDLLLLKASLRRHAEHRETKKRLAQIGISARRILSSLETLSQRLEQLSSAPKERLEAEQAYCLALVHEALSELRREA